ncbi:MAG: SDR family NAD(P)-dependent oxidoreductase [Crocinitomicaceae bacterium]|nr:SDR family NAD(P)-dependent oxidoreductase [Crocinitomicaceae bacterium]
MYIVTGVSRGLGKAIVEQLLANNETVIGIGRAHNIEHTNFSFVKCDLKDIAAIRNLNLPTFEDEVVLINNAAIIGEVKRISDQKMLDLTEVLTVNTIAPAELTKRIYDSTLIKHTFKLINISSGAANRAIPSWAAYCASKASLNMLTESFLAEEREKGNEVTAYAVSPGVIDTDMQEQIREANPEDFSSLDNFKALHENDDLFSPQEAANRLLKLISMPFTGEIKVDLRTIDL